MSDQESIFSKERMAQCDLEPVPPIPDLPEIPPCTMEPVPIMETPVEDLPPVDGCDGIDGQDSTDGLDGQDGRDGDGCDGLDGRDSVDGVDGQDARDGCDGLDGRDSVDGVDGQDARDGCDGLDGRDSLDGADGQDGRDSDGCDGIDGKDAADGVDGGDGRDGVANFFEARLAAPYSNGDDTAYVWEPNGQDSFPVRVPHPQSQCDAPEGTRVRFYTDSAVHDHVLLDMDINCGGGAAVVVPWDTLTCEIIEPIRCPPFYDPNITPNPMAVDPAGFFLPKDIEANDNGYLAFMSMGLVRVMGKEYTPLQATYNGGAEYGRPQADEFGQPLYLMRRELQTAANRCTTRRGKDTSYPFKWRYADGTYFSSGTKDYENYVYETAERRTYTSFLYEINPYSREQYGALHGDDADKDKVRYADYLEMKPYYYGSSIETTEGDGETGEKIPAETGVSPQWWKTTTDREQAQLNYDFAYCPNLEWAETLIPGDKVRCVERKVTQKIPARDGYGNLKYEYVRDESGMILYDQYGRPLVTRQEFEFKTFRYYEITPPDSYRTAIDGQPAVELYIGSPETIGSSTEEFDIHSTLLDKTGSYTRPEDIVSPDYELVYAVLRDNHASADVVNPLAVVSDLQTDRHGTLTQRLRALFYRTDPKDRKYPMLFEVDALHYGYCIEVGNVKHYYGTEHDLCSPHYLREEYRVVRKDRGTGKKGKTLQLASTKCFKHRLQVPVLVKMKNG